MFASWNQQLGGQLKTAICGQVTTGNFVGGNQIGQA
jgi:hypothetical protein